MFTLVHTTSITEQVKISCLTARYNTSHAPSIPKLFLRHHLGGPPPRPGNPPGRTEAAELPLQLAQSSSEVGPPAGPAAGTAPPGFPWGLCSVATAHGAAGAAPRAALVPVTQSLIQKREIFKNVQGRNDTALYFSSVGVNKTGTG